MFNFLLQSPANLKLSQNYISPNHNSSIAACSSFPNKFKTVRSGNSYGSNAKLETSTDEEDVTREVEADAIEGNEEKSERFSSNLVDEKIKASLESLHA